MNIIFFNSETLVTRELINALDTRKDIRLINVPIPPHPSPENVPRIFEKLKAYTPALFLSINDAGYDSEGKMQDCIVQSDSYLVNWYHDFPFYNHVFKNHTYTPSPRRIDFVSEESYVDLLRNRGFISYFLPLATDPAFFNSKEPRVFERNLAFVGNSTLKLMDDIITEEIGGEIEKSGEFFLECKKKYYSDFTQSIRNLIVNDKNKWKDKITIPIEKFIFCMEWMIGFQFRRDFMTDISNTYKENFTLFGDLYWKQFIKESKVTPEACYYDNLCHYYRTTKINLNLNRIQIQTSFTQRHFDTKASGAFLLTDKRACSNRYFITEGPDKEIVEYDSLTHCKELIDYYLDHEEERERIAGNGIERILANHTYKNRIEEIIAVCKKEWGV